MSHLLIINEYFGRKKTKETLNILAIVSFQKTCDFFHDNCSRNTIFSIYIYLWGVLQELVIYDRPCICMLREYVYIANLCLEIK